LRDILKMKIIIFFLMKTTGSRDETSPEQNLSFRGKRSDEKSPKMVAFTKEISRLKFHFKKRELLSSKRQRIEDFHLTVKGS